MGQTGEQTVKSFALCPHLPHVGLGYPLSCLFPSLSIHFLIFCSLLLFFLFLFALPVFFFVHPFPF